jgi:hypothetical protein
MGDVLSIIAIVLLLTVLVVSVRKQRAMAADERAHAKVRAGADGAQYERSVAHRAAARKAHLDSKEHAANDV